MGHHKHHSILISSWGKPHIEAARRRATELKLQTTEIVASMWNGLYTFAVTPDGSKEGWEASDTADASRTELIGWLQDPQNDYFTWVEVEYGDDYGGEPRVLRSYAVSDSAEEA